MAETLRILVVTETYPPDVNGVALTVAGFVTGLRARHADVHVLRPRCGADAAAPADANTHLCAGVPLPRYPALRFGVPGPGTVGRLIDRVRPDVLYIATEGPLGAAALRAATARRLPVATGFHTNFHDYARHYGFGALARPTFAYLRGFHNRADATIVATEALERSLAAAGFRHPTYLPRGIDTALFTPARRDPALRERWGARGDAPVLLSVGRIAAEKNLALVTDAFAHFRHARSDARLVFVGDGPARARLQREHPEAVFCGVQTGGRLAEHYASADLLLFPSETETFGNVTLEGLASGLVVVAYDYAAAHQHMTDGWNGLVAPYGDADAYIARTLRAALDAPLRRMLRFNARRTAEALAPGAVHARLGDLLRGLVVRRDDAVA